MLMPGHHALYSSNLMTLHLLLYSYDLMVACKEVGEGTRHVSELLGDLKIRPISTDGAYQTKLDSKRVTNERILELLQRYTRRHSKFDTEFSSELAPDSNNARSGAEISS